MFLFSLEIKNPFYKGGAEMGDRDLFYRHKQISKFKHFEIQLYTMTKVETFFSINLDLSFKGRDHAGPRFELAIWRFYAEIAIYDSRHWDWDRYDWETRDEEVAP